MAEDPTEKIKILLATGIFPPDIGGPATYVKNLAEELPKYGCEVKIVTYGELKKSPPAEGCPEGGVGSYDEAGNGMVKKSNFEIYSIPRYQNILFRYFKYFWQVYRSARWADIVYAFDISSAGLPASLAAKLSGKKFMVRIGGDFLWEKAANSRLTAKPLVKYYAEPKNFKEKWLMSLNRFVLKRADKIIFTVEWLKKIYEKHYGVKETQAIVIGNPFPNRNQLSPEAKSGTVPELVCAGRLIPLKNLERLIEAVSKIPDIKLRIIGDGPLKTDLKRQVEERGLTGRVTIAGGLPHAELMTEIKKAYALILPSLSEVSPNLMLECISLRKPIIATKECGYFDRFRDQLIFIDPENTEDIKNKIEYLLDKKKHEACIEKIKSIDTSISWPKLIEAHLRVFDRVIQSPLPRRGAR